MSERSDENLTREERLAAKLRENLRRRKSQAREIAPDGPHQTQSDTQSRVPKQGRES
jgi:hypothetical protein